MVIDVLEERILLVMPSWGCSRLSLYLFLVAQKQNSRLVLAAAMI
jgi:hypothetical protein